jgi:hypothetical protein
MRYFYRTSIALRILPTLLTHPTHAFYLREWGRTIWSNALRDRKPWVTFSARTWLDRNLHSDMDVFEFGSGGSTTYFCSRVRKVTSVEHDMQWYDMVKTILGESKVQNLEYNYRAAEISQANSGAEGEYRSVRFAHPNASFKDYVRTIDSYDDESFDFILIDGRARNSCAIHALPKLRKGGYMMLDNSERADYQPIHKLMKDRMRIDFTGLCPYGYVTWTTTVWKNFA